MHGVFGTNRRSPVNEASAEQPYLKCYSGECLQEFGAGEYPAIDTPGNRRPSVHALGPLMTQKPAPTSHSPQTVRRHSCLQVLMVLASTIAWAPPGVASPNCPIGEVFREPVPVGVTRPHPFACTTGDIDLDGVPDALFLSPDGLLQIKLGGPALQSTRELSFTVPGNGFGVGVADFNRDGYWDVALTGDFGLAIMLGNGSGGRWNETFSEPQTYASASNARRLLIADVDSDGHEDVLAGSVQEASVALHRGTGAGTFAPVQAFAAGGTPFAVAAGDFDEDNRVDVAVATIEGSFNVLRGAGSAGDYRLVLAQSYPAAGQLLEIAVADFNVDGIQDVACANSARGTISVFKGLGADWIGDGTFGPVEQFVVGGVAYGMAVGDVDGDSFTDILSCHQGSPYSSLLRGNGDGSFQAQEEIPPGLLATAMTLADVTGDGILDLITAGHPNGLIHVGRCAGATGGPTIVRFSPSGGDRGSTVAIFGTYLTSAVSVLLGEAECPIISGTDYPLSITVPVGATDNPITVTTPNGSVTTVDTFFVGPPPAITSFVPAAARLGKLVLISGQNFVRVTRCSFGEHSSAPFVVKSAEEIEARVDTAATSGTVRVFTRTGSAESSVTFTLLPPDSAAQMISVLDVSNDQGGHVIVRWLPSLLDVTGNNLLSGYRIWRRAGLNTATAASSRGAQRLGAEDGWFWEPVGEVPAARLSGYALTVSTPQDSLASGPGWTACFVQTLTRDPAVFYVSNVDSGFSVDNLSPPVPLPFAANYSLYSVALHWTPSRAADFREFRLHRGPLGNFVPGPSNLVIATRDTGYVDASGGAYYYKLVAVDVHGNTSRVATVSPTNPVAALATAREATSDGQRVHLVWSTSATPAELISVERRTERSSWQTVTSQTVDGSSDLTWFDENVEPGNRYGYRLTWSQEGEVIHSGEVWVEVTAATLAIAGVYPNPSSRAAGFTVKFSLQSSAPASIEVFDPSGRRVARESLTTPRGGTHEVLIAASRALAPGVYLVQLRQGEVTLRTRAAIIQ